MCATCGCGGDDTQAVITGPHEHDHPHDHDHDHDHGDTHDHRHGDAHDHGDGHAHDHGDGHAHDHSHPHEHGGPPTETVTLEQKVLAKNDQLAQENRRWLAERDILALNLTSS